ncbi:MAG: VacJ family lipoprotein [Desulfobacterales bacterium]|jgi:phospholipid-binding lipoprotein MlaA|nr:VacJ family lipoprotein [Desulfobacterales bacterium]
MHGRLPLAVILLIAVWVCPVAVPPAFSAEPSAAGAAAAIEDDDEDDDSRRGATVRDPLETFNRDMFVINDFLLLYVLEPAAKGVKTVVPWEFRTIFRNALNNIRFPVRFVNCLLQGQWEKGGNEFAAFFLNTTVGFLGMADVAAAYPGLNASPEDMGQTFAVWGWEDSAFLTLPFFGPSTVRDALGKLPDRLLDPLFWYTSLAQSLILRGGEAVNDTTFRIGDYEAIKRASLDPYVAIRNGFIQNRQKLIGE